MFLTCFTEAGDKIEFVFKSGEQSANATGKVVALDDGALTLQFKEKQNSVSLLVKPQDNVKIQVQSNRTTIPFLTDTSQCNVVKPNGTVKKAPSTLISITRLSAGQFTTESIEMLVGGFDIMVHRPRQESSSDQVCSPINLTVRCSQ